MNQHLGSLNLTCKHSYRKMKITIIILVLTFVLTGCMFQRPDYLQMITADELNNTLQREDIFLVDVHTPQQQHIKGTDLSIPFNQIEQHQAQLPKDKNTPIYLYCEGGPMGNAAARTLHDLGYVKLFNLEGGTGAWRKAGFAFE